MKTLPPSSRAHGIFLRPNISLVHVLICSFFLASTCAIVAQTNSPKQANDEDYTKKIKEYLSDPRFTTELVDHLPASSRVPTPLKFLGSMPGQPGELYYNADINRYYEELAKDSPRAKFRKATRDPAAMSRPAATAASWAASVSAGSRSSPTCRRRGTPTGLTSTFRGFRRKSLACSAARRAS